MVLKFLKLEETGDRAAYAGQKTRVGEKHLDPD
jgi:hypothetical protein